MTLAGIPSWMMLLSVFVFGAVIGSFLNVCIYRIPQHERLWDQLSGLNNPPSTCPFCRKRILAIDNIPILGWLILRGRCRFCRHTIPIRYMLIETFNGLLLAALYAAIVPAGFDAKAEQSCLWWPLSPLQTYSNDISAQIWLLHAQFLYYAVLVEALLVATFIDFDLRIIPDGATLPAMLVGVIAATAVGHLMLVPVWFSDPSLTNLLSTLLPESWQQSAAAEAVPAWIRRYPHVHGFVASVVGIIVGGGVVWIVRLAGAWVLRQEAMGFGDVILMAMVGSFLGWQASIVVFFLAPLFAMIAVAIMLFWRREREIPYGPYLSLAAVALLFGWKWIWPAAERFFALGWLFPLLAVFMVVLLVASLWIVQGLKYLLGIPLFPPEPQPEWTSADQLSFFAGRDADAGRGGLQSSGWPGVAAGRGQGYVQQWLGRNGMGPRR